MTRAGQAGIPGERRARKLHGQWVPHYLDMMESSAWRVLSFSAYRCLARIEIEHMHHGGKENGALPVTYDHFREYGIDGHAIAPALRELEALGFIEVTEHGVAGNADRRAPNKFRLTYINSGRVMPTHEWRRINTIEEARAIAKAARLSREKPRKWRVQKQKPVGVDAKFRCGFPPLEHPKQAANSGHSPVGVTPITSIFLGDTADVIPVGAASTLSSLPSFVGSKSARKSSRAKKSTWSAPTLTELYPSPRTIDHLKALYKHQAEQAGQPDDVWILPLSAGQRILNETSHLTTTLGVAPSSRPSGSGWPE
jgi:hypothetical protein